MKYCFSIGIALLLLMANTFCNKMNRLIPIPHDNNALTPAGTIDVTTTGATPNDTTVDNAGIQKAIDSAAGLGGGTVWVPSGVYIINVDVSILMRSNVTLSMASGAVLQAHATSTSRNYVIKCLALSNVHILGGQIVGDRNIHTGTGGEWGMGIGIYGCDSVFVKYVTIKDCWGDGITLSSRAVEGAPNPDTRIYIIGVVSDSNRRQGLTIAAVSGVTVDSCTFTHTNGTAPQDGIDLEPDSGTCRNVNIKNSYMAYNVGNGVEMNQNSHSSIYNINVNNNRIHYNAYAGYVQNVSNITFNYDSVRANKYSPAIVTNNCTNCVTTPNY